MLAETDKIIYRKIQLLKVLDASNDYLKTVDLANFLDLSLKTVQKELESLIEDLKNSSYAVKLEKVGNLYRFIKKSSVNMDLIYLDFKRESIYFYLMRKAVFRKTIKEKKEIDYFYSASHLYKNKRIFKTYLMNYGLELDLSTLSIEGNEINIRFLYFRFFWENYRGVEWPFDTIDRQELIIEIEQLDTFLFKSMTEIEKEQFLYWVAIIKIRASNDQLLIENRVKLNQVMFKDMQEFQQIVAKTIGVIEKTTLHSEAVYLYFAYTLTTESTFYKQQLLADLEKDNKNFQIHKMVRELTTKFSQKFSLNTHTNYVDVYFSIYKLFVCESIYQGSLREYESRNLFESGIIKQYEKEFALFYPEVMKNYGKKYSENRYLYQRVLFLFSTLIEESSYRPQINIKILSSGGAIEELLLTKKVQSLANNIAIKDSNAKDLDIIVSDCMVNNTENDLVFYWNLQPTEKEWEALARRIAEIEQDKELRIPLVTN